MPSSSSPTTTPRKSSNAQSWLEGVLHRGSLISSASSSPSRPLSTVFATVSPSLSPRDTASPVLSDNGSSSMSSRGPSTPYQVQHYSPEQTRRASPVVTSEAYDHPYSSAIKSSPTMVRDQSADMADCPVCLESLSMRLQGEKPHINPICGHKLHEACFEAVYGSVTQARNRGPRSGSIGLCGVCRRDMKLGDGGDHSSRRDKFAALSGQPEVNEVNEFKVRSITKRTIPGSDMPQALHDPREDDDVLSATSAAGRGSADTLGRAHARLATTTTTWAMPIITVHSETPTIARSADRQNGRTRVTALVTVEMPSKLPPEEQNSPLPPPSPERTQHGNDSEREMDDTMHSASVIGSDRGDHTGPNTAAPSENGEEQRESEYGQGYAHGGTRPLSVVNEPDPFEERVRDLKERMSDWKGHEPDDFGKLKLYDYLQVAKDNTSRGFFVYLFEEALLCVADDKRKGLTGKLVDNISGGNDRLRLKGRVFVKHIRHVDEGPNLTLTITMGDDSLEGFVISFKERQELEIWKTQIESLIAAQKEPKPPALPSVPPPPPPVVRNIASLGSVRDSMHSNQTSMTSPSSRSGTMSLSSRGSRYTRATTVSSKPGQQQQYRAPNGHHQQQASSSASTLRLSPHAYTALNPVNYPSLDLVLILSVSPPTTAPSAAPLKLRLLRNTLEFLVSSGRIGPRARVAVIAYSAGEGARGMLRKTALLSVESSAGRLMSVVNELGSDHGLDPDRELRAVNHNDDRVTVVTAVNLALDIVLQRHAKASLTGILLVNDGRDGAPKQQMDLVMARAEAASVPIHAFGWGRAHDPSSLWLLSNHTGGTYTFVREWYSLRDSVAGCVGGMLSVAATAVKLHISVPERRWFSIRKVAGVQGAIVSSDGKDTDIELGELRAGETREMLVEVEMSPLGAQRGGDDGRGTTSLRAKRQTADMTATDEFFMNQVGLDPLSMDDYNVFEDEYDSLMDDIPLFEVNASYRDPVAGKFISRLPQPVLLTVTVTPPSSSPAHDHRSSPAQAVSDAGVVRRRIELLCSDMMTRCLLLMSRRNPGQALRLLTETRRIVDTIAASFVPMTSARSIHSGGVARPASPAPPPSSLAPEHERAQAVLRACIEDIDHLLVGVQAVIDAAPAPSGRSDTGSHPGDPHAFESNQRNYAAQQAVVLRDQKAWTGRSSTERIYFRADLAKHFAKMSVDWLAP